MRTSANSGGPVSPQWLLWQFADSAFPTGSFGHSNGLESTRQHGVVRTGADLAAFCSTQLRQLRHGSLAFVVAAHRGNPPFAELDELFDAFTPNHVANRASRAQGQSLLSTAERSFGNETLKQLRTKILSSALPGHLPPVFGSVCAALGLALHSACELFVFTQLRATLSAAVRLGIVGPLEAQSIQYRLAPEAEAASASPETLSLDTIAQTAPVLELYQSTHDRLYSRLFQS